MRKGLFFPGTLCLVLCAAAFAACASEPTLSPYERAILQARFDKDMALRDDERSILAKSVRARFGGLHYFDVDTTYRYHLPLQRAARLDTIRATLRKGGVDRYVRLGTVAFTRDGVAETLAVYQPADGRRTLWLPFTDATTGKESYGGGRYLNPPLLEDGTILVDFNQAYNPDCDYNPERFNCALPPAENRLGVAIRAGEKKSLLHEPG